MLKNMFGGFMVGIANIIPGVSGGTMMVILGIFDKMMETVTNVFKKENKNRKEDIIFILQVLAGVAVGLVGFANVLGYALDNYQYQTMWWFAGLILISLPTLIQQELKEGKIDVKFVILGMALIAALVLLNPGKQELDFRSLEYPAINLANILMLFVVGAISGATMLFPGISGSMVLLIIGKYYIFTGYVKSVILFQPDKLFMLAVMMLGIFVGIYFSALGTDKLLKKNRPVIISFIVGLILMSSIVLIPNSIISLHSNVVYDLVTFETSFLGFVLGGIVIITITYLQSKKES